MKRKLIKTENGYIKFCFRLCNKYNQHAIDNIFGLKFIRDCWKTDENGNDLDKDGSIIPPNSVDTIKVSKWVKKLNYPLILLY